MINPEVEDNFEDDTENWLPVEDINIEIRDEALWAEIAEPEGSYLLKQVGLLPELEGCTYELCLDIPESSLEDEQLLLVISISWGEQLYNFFLEPGYQNCFENLNLPEDIEVTVKATEPGYFYLDNVTITSTCLEFDHYVADVVNSQDYFTGGSPMPGRKFVGSEKYRYGFNGMERDDEVKGDGNSYTTEFRQYDPRIFRWLSIDPLFANFPWQSPYVAFDNNPVFFNDPQGLAAGGPGDENKTEAYGLEGGSEDLVLSDYRDNADLVLQGGEHYELDDAEWLKGKVGAKGAEAVKDVVMKKVGMAGAVGKEAGKYADAYDQVTSNPANTVAKEGLKGVKGGGLAVNALALVGEHHADKMMHKANQKNMFDKALQGYEAGLDATDSYKPLVVVYTSEKLFQDGQVQTVHGVVGIESAHMNSATAEHWGSSSRYAYLGVQNSNGNVAIIAEYESFTIDN